MSDPDDTAGGTSAGEPDASEPDRGAEAAVVVVIDADVCVGIGQCELLEPDVFALDDDLGYSAVVGSGRLPLERAKIVVDKCPSNAIRIVEDGE